MTTNAERRAYLVEQMAQGAHEAWMKAHEEQGTTTRPAPWDADEEFMVPFEQLSDRGKEFDRVIMRSVLETFDRIGVDWFWRPQRGSIKVLNLDEFREVGFFQEANRLFFHPLGLAIEVMQDDDGHITNISGIWDYRDDPEGIAYGKDAEGNEMIDPIKAFNVEAERSRHIEARVALWGSTIQPIAEP